MPTHPEGYVSKRIEQLMTRGGQRRTVLEAALAVHELTTGASEPADYPDSEIRAFVEILEFYRDHWTPARCDFDRAVHELILAALAEYEGRPVRGRPSEGEAVRPR